MRIHGKRLLQSALCVLALCFLLSVACSWDIVTQGEVHKDDETSVTATEPVEIPVVSEIPLIGIAELPEDSIGFKVFSWLTLGHTTYCFVEMEVGELLDGEGSDPDTILVDHTPQ